MNKEHKYKKPLCFAWKKPQSSQRIYTMNTKFYESERVPSKALIPLHDLYKIK